ncbi:MAG: ribosome biogenesis GTPase YlqF [Lachnospiraceae bacterium]|nr:ribosome biogenesis GTPase YlqF [Lachnospiraceae bacterium]
MNIQWYPGHMTKARRAMEESIKLIDVIIEVVDARLPLSSRNPDIDAMGRQKYRIVLLNKADLADEAANAAWEAWFQEQGIYALRLDSRKRDAMKKVQQAVMDACREKIERDRRRGIKNRPIRAMVAGIPNVGKSTFINSFTRKASTKTGNKPGVTRGNQWIRLNAQVELLDTPGILWPKFEDEEVGLRLALVGSMNDEIIQRQELASWGILFLEEHYPDRLPERYAILKESLPGEEDHPHAFRVLEAIALDRNCLKKGGGPDTEKAAVLFLDDLRAGRLGRITLEVPNA